MSHWVMSLLMCNAISPVLRANQVMLSTTSIPDSPLTENRTQNTLHYPRQPGPLETRAVIILILTCVFGFPVFAFALICVLKCRAERLRRYDRTQKLRARFAVATLSLPRGDGSSFWSQDSSGDFQMRSLNPSNSQSGIRDKFVSTPSILYVPATLRSCIESQRTIWEESCADNDDNDLDDDDGGASDNSQQ